MVMVDLFFSLSLHVCPQDRFHPLKVVMQQNCEEEATVDVQFTDLPNALIAYKVPEDLFSDGGLKVRAPLHGAPVIFVFLQRCITMWCRTWAWKKAGSSHLKGVLWLKCNLLELQMDIWVGSGH